MKEIPLTQNKKALVDDDDIELLSKHTWCAWWSGRRWYAQCRFQRKVIYMHRLVTNASNGLEVDHIDKDGLNNQKSNLRVCTRGQNSRNTGKSKSNKSGYKGVCWASRRQSWLAQIKADGKNYFLGHYDDPIEAARAYDAKARELFGEFARTNF